MYSITFHFESLEELESYVERIIKWETKEKKLLSKKDAIKNDKRGSMTKILHKEAKLIHQNDSSKTYKECLKLAGLKLKQNKINLKEN